MFKLQTDRQTWLQVRLPDPDGEARIRLKVKLISHGANVAKKHQALQEQIERLQAEAEMGDIKTADGMLVKFIALAEAIGPEAIARDIDAIVARVTDWNDVSDEAGEPLSYSPERLRAVLDMGTWVVKAIRQALTDLDDDGKRKN